MLMQSTVGTCKRLLHIALYGCWTRDILRVCIALAFLFQGLIAQTHIHKHLTTLLTHPAADHGSYGGHSGTPLDGDEANCPLCQAVVHLSVLLSPATPLVLPSPQNFGFARALSLAIEVFRIPAIGWHQRAPPRP